MLCRECQRSPARIDEGIYRFFKKDGCWSAVHSNPSVTFLYNSMPWGEPRNVAYGCGEHFVVIPPWNNSPLSSKEVITKQETQALCPPASLGEEYCCRCLLDTHSIRWACKLIKVCHAYFGNQQALTHLAGWAAVGEIARCGVQERSRCCVIGLILLRPQSAYRDACNAKREAEQIYREVKLWTWHSKAS